MKEPSVLSLPSASPGTRRELHLFRYGSIGQKPKAYLQAGLHADEAPGYAVLHFLMAMLEQAEQENRIVGEIVVVPAANPIGLAQWRDESLHGRFAFANSINFNRQHIDLYERVLAAVKDRLGPDQAHNIELIRQSCREALEQTPPPEDEVEFLKHLLLQLSHDADIVLDLHCDHQALMHLYLGTPLWPEGADLAAQIGAEATLLADDSGGTPFDEANSRLWWRLAKTLPEYPIAPACFSATVELRGILDTQPEQVKQDALHLYYFLQRRALISGTPPPLPPLINEATPLTGVDYITAGEPGVLLFQRRPGDRVDEGEVLALIINPLPIDDQPRVSEVTSKTAGLLLARSADRFARPGRIIAKVAGQKPLREPGSNLLTL